MGEPPTPVRCSHVLGRQIFPFYDADGQRAALGHRGSATWRPGREGSGRLGPLPGAARVARLAAWCRGQGGGRAGAEGSPPLHSPLPVPRARAGRYCRGAPISGLAVPKGRGPCGPRPSLVAWSEEGRGLRGGGDPGTKRRLRLLNPRWGARAQSEGQKLSEGPERVFRDMQFWGSVQKGGVYPPDRDRPGHPSLRGMRSVAANP